MDDFIRNNVIRDENRKVYQDEMYANYLNYCHQEGIMPRPKIWFGREMKMFGFGSTLNSQGVREHVGMRLKE